MLFPTATKQIADYFFAQKFAVALVLIKLKKFLRIYTKALVVAVYHVSKLEENIKGFNANLVY